MLLNINEQQQMLFRQQQYNQAQNQQQQQQPPPPSSSANCNYTCSSVSLNAAAALFHAIQAIIVLGLVSWLNTQPAPSNKIGVFPLTRTISVWHKKPLGGGVRPAMENAEFDGSGMVSDDFYIEFKKLSSGELDVRYVIVAFFTLSAIFQIVGGYLLGGIWGSRLRFIEYSFSASIMIIAIAVESGIRDFYTLAMMFVLIWVTMILGLLADFISVITVVVDKQLEFEPLLIVMGPRVWLVPHIAAWVTCLAAYGPILDVFIQSSSKSDVQAPGFVHVIVFLQFVLFSIFGLVQMYSLVRRTSLITDNTRGGGKKYFAVLGNDVGAYSGGSSSMQFQAENNIDKDLSELNDFVEKAYITLSFVAKTLLSWLILSPILAGAIK